jgi:hypothetical protein
MKVQPVNQNYVVLDQQRGLSKITGHPYVKITFAGTRDRDEYTTYVDNNNHNYENWLHIINNPTHGFILSNLKVKRHKDRLLVDADSRPIIQAEDSDQSRVMDMLMEVWKEQDNKPVARFKELFE